MTLDYLLLLGSMFHTKGGIEAFNRNLVHALNTFDSRRSTALLLNDNMVPPDWAGLKQVQLCTCAEGRLRFLWKARFAVRAVLAVLGRRPRFIICGHINFLRLCYLIKLFTRTEYILITHGVEAWHIDGWLTQRAFVAAHKVLSVSRYTRDRILQQVPAANVELLPNAVDTDRFKPAEPSPELIERYELRGCRVLLTVGRLSSSERYKGHETVFRALPFILRVVPSVRYLIVGWGDYESYLRDLAAEMGLEDKVIFAGRVDDARLPDYYPLCDLFVMPSKGEGFGITFLEALACGRPVIAGNSDGSRDAVLDGRLGILVDPDDSEAVARAVIDILTGAAAQPLRDPVFLRNTVAAQFGLLEFRARLALVLQLTGGIAQAVRANEYQ